MKNFYYFSLLAIVALMGSCAAPITTILTKGSQRIDNALIYDIKKDTVYYSRTDNMGIGDIITTRGRQYEVRPEQNISDSIHAIHAGELLAGFNYRIRKLKPFYQELSILPEDSVVETYGSSLVPRNNKRGKYEYVLSLSPDENYMIPRKDILSFYQRHSPDAYALHKRGKTLLSTGIGLEVGALAMLFAGFALNLCGVQCVGYETVKGPYGFPQIVPIYETNQAMRYSALGMYIGCIVANIASSALINIGDQKQKEAWNLYNMQAQKSTPELSLNAQVSGNGIGIALQF